MVALTGIRSSHSCARDAREAVREFHAAVVQSNMALVVFFCSSDYDLEAIAGEMANRFGGVPVVGCTTAGEIGPAGYRDHSLAGASFPVDGFDAVIGRIGGLRDFRLSAGEDLAQELLQRLESRAAHATADNCFALLLIDGLSVREEHVTRALQGALGRIPLVGGSAGDGVSFRRTLVYSEGRFHADSAALVLVSTRLPFVPFMTQHFVATNERLVVTAADAANRLVYEINGLPAAPEYARIVGLDESDLDPLRFAAWPIVVMIDGTNYVRSIQKANPDGSLTFFCAIENGLVLRVAKGVNLVENLEQAFSRVREKVGVPQLVLGCDCILRKLEVSQDGLRERVGDIFRRNNTIGFNTYGEQFHGMHINQTLVGIAIGSGDPQALTA